MTSTSVFCRGYLDRLHTAFSETTVQAVGELATALYRALQDSRHVFIAGNGGSAANAMHLANDFLYGVGRDTGHGLRVEALPANPSVLTCLANDLSYEEVFAAQIRVKGDAGDMLLVLSGSGDSPNVVKAIEAANAKHMRTFAILGFSGGRCRQLAQVPIHFAIDDMQIAEDLQLMVGHMCMQWVRQQLLAEAGLGA